MSGLLENHKSTVFLKNFLHYSAASLLCRGLTFLIAPITIAFLSPTEFGLLSLTNSFVVIMTIITGLGLRHTLTLEYVHCNRESRDKLISNLVITYFLIAVPLFCFLSINRSLINHYFFCDQSSTAIILISLLLCFFTFFIEFFQQALQFRTQISLATKLQLAAALCSVLLIILFLVFFRLSVVGVIAAQLLGMFIVYAYPFARAAIQGFKLAPSLHQVANHIPSYLKLGLPFVPGMLCNWIMASGDRWFLANYSTIHNVGIYTVADAFGGLFHIIISNSITAVYLPHLLKKFANNKEKISHLEATNKKIMYASLIGAFVIVTLGYVMVLPLLYLVLPTAYSESIAYIWFTFIGYIFLMGTYFASILIQFHKKAYFLAFSLVIPALFNCVLNRMLIPHYAIYGCLTATVSSYLLYFMITLTYNYMLVAKHKQLKEPVFDISSIRITPEPLSCKDHHKS